MKFSTRQLVILAVFGALWGVVEISFGSVLHALNIPLTGAFMAAMGVIVALIGRLFVPRRGATLFIGVIAIILKLFSIGNIVIGPMIGILAEAILAELILSLFGQPRRASFILAGAAGVLWTLLQPFITGPLLFGRGLIVFWLDTIDTGARLFGLNSEAAAIVLAILAGLHLLIGAAAGWLAWQAGHLLVFRMQGAEPTVSLENR